NSGFSPKPSRSKSSTVTSTASGTFSKMASSFISSKTCGMSVFMASRTIIAFPFNSKISIFDFDFLFDFPSQISVQFLKNPDICVKFRNPFNQMAKLNQSLGEFIIENQNEFKYSSGELSRLINSIRLAAKVVNHKVNKAGLVDILGNAGNSNIQVEDQQKLDVFANEVFINTLTNREIVCGIASEEEDEFITIKGRNEKNDNKYVVLIDPLDGSSNIDVNVSVGTIFSIYRRITPSGTPVTIDDFLQP